MPDDARVLNDLMSVYYIVLYDLYCTNRLRLSTTLSAGVKQETLTLSAQKHVKRSIKL